MQAIPLWYTERELVVDQQVLVPSDKRLFLELDTCRLDELTKAWMPVTTAFGPGDLVFKNSD